MRTARSVGRYLPIAFLLLVVAGAILAPWIAPFPPNSGNLAARLSPPRWTLDLRQHLLGTDALGRDILSRLLHGARISLAVALVSVVGAGVIGTIAGLLAGYCRGTVDTIITGITDVALSIPMFLMAILLVAILGPSLANVVAVIILLLWPYYARQMRAEAMALMEQDFVLLAQVANCSPARIMLRHLLPNALPTLIVLATMQTGYVMLLEAALSFLGVGIPPPAAAWGLMVGDGQKVLASAWWVAFWPGACISLTVLATNLAGDVLRDWLDPRMRNAPI